MPSSNEILTIPSMINKLILFISQLLNYNPQPMTQSNNSKWPTHISQLHLCLNSARTQEIIKSTWNSGYHQPNKKPTNSYQSFPHLSATKTIRSDSNLGLCIIHKEIARTILAVFQVENIVLLK